MADRLAALARAVMRWWLPFKERERAKALEAAFETIKDQAIKSEQRGYKASLTVFNIALYFLIAERDIQCLKIDALTHPNEWKRKLCTRVILLTIHEWDADKVSGSALRNALDSMGASDNVRAEAIEALRAVRIVQRKARKEFGLLRNATIAHRDVDALIQYRAISNLKTEEVFRMAAEFYAGARRYVDVIPKLIAESGTMPALLRQWLESNREQN
jgi:hypothetical protein